MVEADEAFTSSAFVKVPALDGNCRSIEPLAMPTHTTTGRSSTSDRCSVARRRSRRFAYCDLRAALPSECRRPWPWSSAVRRVADKRRHLDQHVFDDSVHAVGDDTIEVDAGVDWRGVVEAALGYGRAPSVLPNFLDYRLVEHCPSAALTTFRGGAQADQALELEVVTGEGRVVTCSNNDHRDLFEAVLAGQGQCGIIARAVVRIESAPTLVREYFLPYANLDALLRDGREVVRNTRFDGVVAWIVASDRGWSYVLTANRHYTPPNAPDDAEQLAELQFIRGAERIRTVDYLQYVDTVPEFDAS